MPYTAPVETPSGHIREVTIGTGSTAVTVGGARALPFYSFDAELGRRPVIAMEVYDLVPDGWAAALKDTLGDLFGDPVAWAKACMERFGADLVCVQLAGTDPNGANRSADEAAAVVKSILDEVGVPLVVYGSGNADKDVEVLKKVAEIAEGSVLAIGAATEDNYKPITAAALGYGHVVIAETPIDVNMAKQLNILITQIGLAPERILVDPSVGSVGYGIEYAYTVMERLRLAALNQNDDMTQMPMICNLGKEAWRTKEARASAEEEAAWGDAAERGVLWEATTAMTLALGGGDVLVMRHPEAVAILRKAIDGLLGE